MSIRIGNTLISGASAIIDALNSTRTDASLSAKQGKVLSEGKQDKEAGKGLSSNDYTTAEKTKLAGIEAGAKANVNADWNAASGDAQILNKPSLATVATSGSYNDLSNKPTIPSAVTEQTVSGWGFTKNTGDEVTSRKVTSLSAQSTDEQYPSAKCVYDMIGNVESLLNALL